MRTSRSLSKTAASRVQAQLVQYQAFSVVPENGSTSSKRTRPWHCAKPCNWSANLSKQPKRRPLRPQRPKPDLYPWRSNTHQMHSAKTSHSVLSSLTKSHSNYSCTALDTGCCPSNDILGFVQGSLFPSALTMAGAAKSVLVSFTLASRLLDERAGIPSSAWHSRNHGVAVPHASPWQSLGVRRHDGRNSSPVWRSLRFQPADLAIRDGLPSHLEWQLLRRNRRVLCFQHFLPRSRNLRWHPDPKG